MPERSSGFFCAMLLLVVAGYDRSRAAPGSSPAPSEDPAASKENARLSGRWKALWEDDESQREYYFDLVEDGDRVSGSFISPRSGAYPVTAASVSGDKVKIVIVRKYSGVPVELNVDGEFDGRRTIHGSVEAAAGKVGELSMWRLPDPAGEWKAKSRTPDGGIRESVLRVARTKDGYTGTFTSGRGSVNARSVGWKEDRFVIELSLPAGEREVAFLIDAAFEDRNTMKGRWTAGARATGEWSASREAKLPLFDPAGRWKAVSTAKDGARSKVSVLEIVAEGSGYRATYSGERGEAAYRKVSCDGEELRLELELDVEGVPVTFTVKAEFRDANTLEGRWQVEDYEEYAGKWRATRG